MFPNGIEYFSECPHPCSHTINTITKSPITCASDCSFCFQYASREFAPGPFQVSAVSVALAAPLRCYCQLFVAVGHIAVGPWRLGSQQTNQSASQPDTRLINEQKWKHILQSTAPALHNSQGCSRVCIRISIVSVECWDIRGTRWKYIRLTELKL